jgi:hypothetical protein
VRDSVQIAQKVTIVLAWKGRFEARSGCFALRTADPPFETTKTAWNGNETIKMGEERVVDRQKALKSRIVSGFHRQKRQKGSGTIDGRNMSKTVKNGQNQDLRSSVNAVADSENTMKVGYVWVECGFGWSKRGQKWLKCGL